MLLSKYVDVRRSALHGALGVVARPFYRSAHDKVSVVTLSALRAVGAHFPPYAEGFLTRDVKRAHALSALAESLRQTRAARRKWFAALRQHVQTQQKELRFRQEIEEARLALTGFSRVGALGLSATLGGAR